MEAVGDRDGHATAFHVRPQDVQTTEHGVWGMGCIVEIRKAKVTSPTKVHGI